MITKLQNILLKRRNDVEVAEADNQFLQEESAKLYSIIKSIVSLRAGDSLSIDSIEINDNADIVVSFNDGDYELSLFGNELKLETINDMTKQSEVINELKASMLPHMLTAKNNISEETKRKTALVATVAKNFEALGYSMSQNLFNSLMHTSDENIQAFYDNYIPQLKELVGANVEYNPMYPNFPKQVMEMSDVELFVNAIVHYWSFGTLLPDYEKIARPELTERTEYKYLDVAKDGELEDIISNLMSSTISIGASEKEDLRTYADSVKNWTDIIPDTGMPNKENMAYVASMILEKAQEEGRKPTAKDFNGMFKTPTDILRFIVSQSTYRDSGTAADVSLDALNKVHYGNNIGQMRDLIMELLDETGEYAGQDISKYRDAWTLIAQKVHPGNFANKYPHAVESLVGTYELEKTIKPQLKELKLYEALEKLPQIEEKYNSLVEDSRKFKNRYTGKNPQQYIDNEINQLLNRVNTLNNLPAEIKTNILNVINEFKDNVVKQGSIKLATVDAQIKLDNAHKMLNEINREYYYNPRARLRAQTQKDIENYKKVLDDLKVAAPADVKTSKEILNTLNADIISNRRLEINNEIAPTLTKIQAIDEKNQRIEQKLAKYMNKKDYVNAINLLSQYPGVFARKMDELLRKYTRTDDVLNAFEKVADQVSPAVLLQLKAHIARRNEEAGYRAFTFAGLNSEMYITEKTLEPLPDEICNKLDEICSKALVKEFTGKEGYKNVYVDEQFKKQIIPQGIRSATKGKETYIRGSRFSLEKAEEKMERENAPIELKDVNNNIEALSDKINTLENNIKETINIIKSVPAEELNKKAEEISVLNKALEAMKADLAPLKEELYNVESRKKELETLLAKEESKYVRGFIWWTNMGGSSRDDYDDDDDYGYGNRVDIDLSAVLYDENCKYKSHVSYTNLRDGGIVHSGDITNGGSVKGKGAAEFIDFDPEEVLKQGARYISFQVNSYSGQHFNQMPNVSFGWMERDDMNKGEIFEPKTVKQKLDLSSDRAMTVPVMFDCETKEFIWVDMSLNVGYCSNVESTIDKTQALVKSMVDPHKENLKTLIDLNIEANGGNVIDNTYELQPGDTAFVMDYPKNKIDGVKYIRPMDIDIITNDLMRQATKEEIEKMSEVEKEVYIETDDLDRN